MATLQRDDIRPLPGLALVLLAMALSPLSAQSAEREIDEIRLRRNSDAPTGQTNGLAFSHNGERLAAASQDGVVRIWSVKDVEVTQTIGRPRKVFLPLSQTGYLDANSITFSPDLSLIHI